MMETDMSGIESDTQDAERRLLETFARMAEAELEKDSQIAALIAQTALLAEDLAVLEGELEQTEHGSDTTLASLRKTLQQVRMENDALEAALHGAASEHRLRENASQLLCKNGEVKSMATALQTDGQQASQSQVQVMAVSESGDVVEFELKLKQAKQKCVQRDVRIAKLETKNARLVNHVVALEGELEQSEHNSDVALASLTGELGRVKSEKMGLEAALGEAM
eukprot:SAG11_NODE_5559_length_1525_cov_2.302244_1_plen_222_part_10